MVAVPWENILWVLNLVKSSAGMCWSMDQKLVTPPCWAFHSRVPLVNNHFAYVDR